MKIERRYVTVSSTLEDFADAHGLVMQIREALNGYHRYSAAFRDAEIMDHGMLISASGYGDTEAEAMANCAGVISGRRIVVGAYTKGRREIAVPRLEG